MTFFISKNGEKSLKAAQIAARAGFNAITVDGGYEAWVTGGHPILEPDPDAPKRPRVDPHGH